MDDIWCMTQATRYTMPTHVHQMLVNVGIALLHPYNYSKKMESTIYTFESFSKTFEFGGEYSNSFVCLPQNSLGFTVFLFVRFRTRASTWRASAIGGLYRFVRNPPWSLCWWGGTQGRCGKTCRRCVTPKLRCVRHHGLLAIFGSLLGLPCGCRYCQACLKWIEVGTENKELRLQVVRTTYCLLTRSLMTLDLTSVSYLHLHFNMFRYAWWW